MGPKLPCLQFLTNMTYGQFYIKSVNMCVLKCVKKILLYSILKKYLNEVKKNTFFLLAKDVNSFELYRNMVGFPAKTTLYKDI